MSFVVFFVAQKAQEDVFFDRLDERVKVTEEFFLENETLSDEVKRKVRNQFLQTLPKEVEYVQQLDEFPSIIPSSVQKELPENILATLKKQRSIQWAQGQKQGRATVYRKNKKDFVVVVIAEDSYGHRFLEQLALILIIASLIAIISSLVMSAYFSRKVLRPIAEKIEKANQISASQLDLRLTVYNESDELGMLAKSFNKLLDRLQESIELEKNFVRYASHELKNPLAVILGESEVALMSSRTENEYIKTIEKIKAKADNLNDLIDHFLQLSRLESSQLTYQHVNIDELLVEIILELSQNNSDVAPIEFEVDANLTSENLVVSAERMLLSKAFFNLIENAMKFSQHDSQVKVSLMSGEKENTILVHIEDSGQGIPSEDLEHIFTPLFRGNNTTEVSGTGIGLALVKKVLTLHDAPIHVHSELNKGTRFTVELTCA